MTGQCDLRLAELHYPLDVATPEGSLVEAVTVDGFMVYASGQVAFNGDRLAFVGKVPSEVDPASAKIAASLCAANVLRAVRRKLGTLDYIARVVRITGYVNSDVNFTDQHLVLNGASELVLAVFGEAGKHARTAIGVSQLPLNSSVEVEMVLRLNE